MRLYNKILLGAVALSSLTTTSCLKDQKDLFCDEPSVRLEKRMQECQQTLTGSEYGWIMDYYPDRDKSYGGFVYGLKFTDAETTVTCELAPGETETSYYKMTNDNGPVLSFDTYNTLMHYFATPNGDRYEAYDGDFEFIILDITPDLITLKGNRSGNVIYMHRATSDVVDYVAKASEIGESIFQTEFKGTCGSAEANAANDLGVRYLEFQWKVGEGDNAKIETSGSYYVPTATGIHFYEPVQAVKDGGEITDLTFDMANFVFSGQDSKGNAISLKGVVGANYSFYDEFIGNFTMTYAPAGSLDIQIVADQQGSSYLIKGITNACDIKATYNKSVGGIDITGQIIGETAQDVYKFLGALATGNFYPNALGTIGMVATKDVNNPGTFVFSDNGYASEPITGFTIVQQRDGKYYYPSAPYVFTNGDSEMNAPVKLIKK
jgi:hypothetical protein